MQRDANYYISPKRIMSRQDLEKTPPPTSSGVYSWWLDMRLLNKLLLNVLDVGSPEYVKGWIFRRSWKRVYIGKGINLKRRILDYHFCGDADVSSLRLSLGCLLVMELKICLWKRPRPEEDKYGYTFGDEGEEKLSKWMDKNAKVAWSESPNYEKLEEEAIIEYAPVLNTEKNPRPFKPLKFLRDEMKACALLRGHKPPWKCVKTAYEKFEEQCKSYP